MTPTQTQAQLERQAARERAALAAEAERVTDELAFEAEITALCHHNPHM